MTISPHKSQANYQTSGAILLGLGIITLAVTIGCAVLPGSSSACVIGILALLLGKLGFDNLEMAAKCEPSALDTFIHKLDLFSSLLKTGEEIHVLLQVQYDRAEDERATLARIQTELQRTLNSYLSKADRLSDDPFTEMDHLVQTSVAPLAKRLGLQGLELKTIDVKRASSIRPSQGIYFGNVKQ